MVVSPLLLIRVSRNRDSTLQILLQKDNGKGRFADMKTKSTEAPELDPLASRLEEALMISGESQTRFGYLHFGDPAFFKKMRAGRSFRPRTQARIEDVLKEYGV